MCRQTRGPPKGPGSLPHWTCFCALCGKLRLERLGFLTMGQGKDYSSRGRGASRDPGGQLLPGLPPGQEAHTLPPACKAALRGRAVVHREPAHVQ